MNENSNELETAACTKNNGQIHMNLHHYFECVFTLNMR